MIYLIDWRENAKVYRAGDASNFLRFSSDLAPIYGGGLYSGIRIFTKCGVSKIAPSRGIILRSHSSFLRERKIDENFGVSLGGEGGERVGGVEHLDIPV